MSERNQGKLYQLVKSLGDADLVSARWLRAHGYSTSLVARYVRSGWLRSPARGVYGPARGVLGWDGVLRSLQQREGLRLHAGGRFALAWRGHEHYLRLGEAARITLYGPDRLPGWVSQLPLAERFEACGRGPFAPTELRFTADMGDEALFAQGLERHAGSSSVGDVVIASVERAMLELCDAKPGAALIHEADAVMQGLAGLRPNLLGRLLQQCRSVKAKRLFLALAERHAHPWLARISLDAIDLGSGKRVLVPGGRLHPKYLITLPRNLDEQLG